MGHSGRAIRLGTLTVVAQGQSSDKDDLAVRLAAHGYHVYPTPHFVVCRHPGKRSPIVIHRFSETTVDEDLPSFAC